MPPITRCPCPTCHGERHVHLNTNNQFQQLAATVNGEGAPDTFSKARLEIKRLEDKCLHAYRDGAAGAMASVLATLRDAENELGLKVMTIDQVRYIVTASADYWKNNASTLDAETVQ